MNGCLAVGWLYEFCSGFASASHLAMAYQLMILMALTRNGSSKKYL